MLRWRRLDPGKIDFGILRAWLGNCSECHEEKLCRPSPGASLEGLRAINCQTKTIEVVAPGSQYIALSYVWGTAASASSTTSAATPIPRSASDASLPASAPLVVKDAMEVVIQLGHTYLWVDQFCINQTDVAEKSYLIANMDAIYDCAYATIFAASGRDASHGLPGISTRARLPQPSALINGTGLAAAPPDAQQAVHTSVWSSRAWVYQEAIFSTRRLFFTPAQVYFECNTAHSSE
ncbi:HET-domain-containing protein, partial [Saccharata proteae CBS 121410]